jgi:hypothetical protein
MIQLEKDSLPEAVRAMRDLFCRPAVVSGGGVSALAGEIDEIFEASGRALLILGAPGSGKTVTLLELARRLVESAKADPSAPAPVVLNLSSWSDRFADMETWIAEEIFRTYRIPRKIARKWVADVEGHPLVFLLDGLDEVKPAFQTRCAAAVNRFRESHGLSGVAVACREADYQSIAETLHLETAVRIRPLTQEKIQDYLDALGPDFSTLIRALETDPALGELARSPLMLGIMTLAYQGNSTHLPTSEASDGAKVICREDIFNAYINQALQRRRSPGDPSDKKTVNWLIWLANYMSHRNISVFFIENLQPDSSSSAIDKLSYLVLSRTTTCCCMLISWALFVLWMRSLRQTVPIDIFFWTVEKLIRIGPIMGLFLAIFDFGSFSFKSKMVTNREKNLFLLFTFIFLTFLLSIFSFSTPKLVIQWMDISMTTALRKESIELIYHKKPLGITNLGLFLGMFFTARNINKTFSNDIQLAERIKWDWKAFLAFYLITGIFPSILLGLFREFDPFSMAYFFLVPSLLISFFFSLRFGTIEKQKTKPNQGIQMSLRNALVIGCGFGIFIALTFILAGPITHFFPGHWIGAICFGLVVSFITGLWYGGIDAINHYTLRILIFSRGYFPWNCSKFLDSSANRILMRKVGGGYIFLHRLLLEHFASMKKPGI